MLLSEMEVPRIQISRIMSTPVVFAGPLLPVRQAAALMREKDIGALPIVEGGRPIGVATDRDIVIRIVALGADTGDTPIKDAMSSDPISCFADQDASDATAIMGDAQIRRLLVIDRSGKLVGLLSIGDIAENASELLAGEAIGEVSEDR